MKRYEWTNYSESFLRPKHDLKSEKDAFGISGKNLSYLYEWELLIFHGISLSRKIALKIHNSNNKMKIWAKATMHGASVVNKDQKGNSRPNMYLQALQASGAEIGSLEIPVGWGRDESRRVWLIYGFEGMPVPQQSLAFHFHNRKLKTASWLQSILFLLRGYYVKIQSPFVCVCFKRILPW